MADDDEQRENENLLHNEQRRNAQYGPSQPPRPRRPRQSMRQQQPQEGLELPQLQQQLPQLQQQPPEQPPSRRCWRYLGICTILILLTLLSLSALALGVYSTIEVRKQQIQQIQQIQIHTTYEKIGSKNCDGVAGTSKMFSGLTVGFATETGATEYKCVSTDDNIKNRYYNYTFSVYKDEKHVKFLNVTKYKTFRVGKSDFDAACSKCSVSGRSVIDMVPGQYDCDNTWTKEYNGYLMTDEGSTTFNCVDLEMEKEPGTKSVEVTPVLRHVVLTDTITNFQSKKVLSCVVCSK